MVNKNNVSYFQAGFEAALRTAGVPEKEVRRRFYSTIEYPNLMREFLRAYDSKEFDDEGIVAMHDAITQKSI